MKVLELIEKIDPIVIEQYLPGKVWKERFEALKTRLINLGQVAFQMKVTPELLQEIDSVADGFREIYLALNGTTELAAKARLNEAILWAESYNLERSIYLAGIAKEQKVKEPYRTQIKNLPAHACLTRYRQSFQVAEWVKNNLESQPHGVVAHILEGWQSSFLAQFSYFATEAYLTNPTHNQTIYHRLLSALLMHRAMVVAGREEPAKFFEKQAYDFLHEFREPEDGMHYMQANYLQRAAREFGTFRRLSAEHPRIAERLTSLAAQTADFEFFKPLDYFSITPYLVNGTRAASMLGVICGGGALVGWDISEIQNAVAELWGSVEGQVFGDAHNGPLELLSVADNGGYAGPALIDSGGLGRGLLADSGGAALLESIDLASLMA